MFGARNRFEALQREVEHTCALVQRLVDRIDRIDGRLERLELYLLSVDPEYPVTQAEIAPADLEAKRARLEAALNGEQHADHQ